MSVLGLGLGLPFRTRAVGGGGGGDPTLALDLDFSTGVLDPRITFTRASVGCRFNGAGVLETIGVNVPRFDYYKSTGAFRGLLVEESRINVCLWSRDLTNAAWVRTNCTAVKDQTGLDAVSNSASRITASAANGTCLQTITISASSRIFSCWMRRLVGSGTIQMTGDNGVTWTTVTPTASFAQVSIPSQSLLNPTVGFRIVTSGDSVAVDFAQHEAGTTAGGTSSPIETTAAAATRSAENATISGANFNFYNATEGTLLVDFMTSSMVGSHYAASLGQNGGNNSIHLLTNGTNARLESSTNGVSQAAFTAGVITADTRYRLAGRAKLNDFAASLNGAATVPDADGLATMPVTINQLGIGRPGTSFTGVLHGWVRRIQYYNVAKSNAELEALSTIPP